MSRKGKSRDRKLGGGLEVGRDCKQGCFGGVQTLESWIVVMAAGLYNGLKPVNCTLVSSEFDSRLYLRTAGIQRCSLTRHRYSKKGN